MKITADSETEDRIINAIREGDIIYLNELVKQGMIDIRLPNNDNDTPLLYAMSCGDECTYRFLLENNADINTVNDEGENIFHAIVYSDDAERVDYLVNKYPECINFLDKPELTGITPLIWASVLEKEKIAIKFAELGANINAADDEGFMPIHGGGV